MMDKLINWALVGVALFLMNFVVDMVEPWAGDNAEMKRMFLWVITGIMIMCCSDCEGESLMDRIIKCWFGFVMNALMIVFAILVYIVIDMLVSGGFDVMGLVYAAGFIFIASMMFALFWCSVKNAMRS